MNVADGPPTASPPSAGAERRSLKIEGLTVRFGGVTAVDTLDLEVPVGRITGLIGPNGAGKTTTFNACCGLVRFQAGRVILFSTDVSRQSPAARARRGLGRTFQRTQLCDSLTVADNVLLGAEARSAGANPIHQLWSGRAEQASLVEAQAHALELCGLSDQASAYAGALSTGRRRLVELARVIAGGYEILLLDEPSSGLDTEETEAFGEILQRLARERAIGVLLVEHDIALVNRVCEYVYVLDFGRLIAEGEAGEVLGSETVRDAYLGTGIAA